MSHHTFDTAKKFFHREAIPATIAVIILASAVLFAAHAGATAPQTAGSAPADSMPTTEPVVESTHWEQVTTAVPFETVRTANHDLPLGQERILQQGADGSHTALYEVTEVDGREVSRRLVGESVVSAVEEIIEYGTAAEVLSGDDRISQVQTNQDGSGLLTFDSGATLKFTAVKNVTATAYTAGRGGAGYITASGTPARAGAVAVDRRVIPLGSKLYIVTDDGKYVYGLAVAEDTGVIGNRVDLYYDDYEQCIIFGRRPATIYILED